MRSAAIFSFSDLNNPEMWEFGIIARNLLAGIGFQHTAIINNVPSAYMPPGLPYIYYFFFMIFSDNSFGYIMILFLNVIISSFSVLIIYIVSNNIYNKNTALLSAAYASFSPVYIYSAVIFSPVVYYHLFSSLCFLYFLRSYNSNGNPDSKTPLRYSTLLSVSLGLFLYIRAEILILIFILFLLYIIKKQVYNALLILCIPLIIISPWTIRNYIVFGKIIPVTTSAGYNFYTGHGDAVTTIEYNRRVNSLTEDSSFEIKKSDIGYETAFKYIKEDPAEDLRESLSRIADLWIFDRYRESTANPLYLIPWLLTLLLFVFGYYYSLKDKIISSKLLYLKIYIIFVTLLVIVFFNIPRYQVQVSFIMIPTAMYAVNILFSKAKGKVKV